MSSFSLFPDTLVNLFSGKDKKGKPSPWFDLTSPDPVFCDLENTWDQLPGRPKKGKIEIARFFERLRFFTTDAQQNGYVNGGKIFQEFKRTNAAVLGMNVGQYLFENQDLIPVEFRGKVDMVFWGNIYLHPGNLRFVRYLGWSNDRWFWYSRWIDSNFWGSNVHAVLLVE